MKITIINGFIVFIIYYINSYKCNIIYQRLYDQDRTYLIDQ